MQPRRSSHELDGRIARLLSELPAYRRWRPRPLERTLRHQLAELDEQSLMTVAAEVLVRLTRPR